MSPSDPAAGNSADTPGSLGYRMPAEWEPHEATWIAWPHQRSDWPGKFRPIPWVYVEIVRHLSRSERVNILIRGRTMRRRAAEQLSAHGVDLEPITFVKAKTDRVWLRDSGPTFLVKDGGGNADNDDIALVDWRFNGWAKYPDHHHDNRIPCLLAQRLGLRRWVPRFTVEGAGQEQEQQQCVVMEGGAIDVNGRGALLTTEECLLSPVQARNPGRDRAALERVFADFLGVRHVIWLGRGIAGDDTHGHVDDLARFVDARTVVTVVEPRRDDPNHAPLEENVRRLEAACDQEGRPLRVVTLPMPGPVVFEGDRLPASYANFYIANRHVLVPTFNDPLDRVALDTLAALFPARQVVGIHAVDLVLGLGTLHCLSQQQPARPCR
jgi:agmatine deiminase